jgi:hypothetical protein
VSYICLTAEKIQLLEAIGIEWNAKLRATATVEAD